TQGYIGQTAEGANTTLGRGGSDYSAALVAEAVSADILEIWTDVAGIATTDPRICPNAAPISEISFSEASELATFGAKILHPATLAPALRSGIPVYVGSSYEPAKEGTWVRKETVSAPLIRAMAVRRNQVLLTISTPKMLQAHGFLAAIFKIFSEHKISVDAITTSEISVAMTLNDASQLTKNLIKDLSDIGDVKVEEGLSLVSIIGNNILHTAGLGKKIFSTLEEINIRMICLGASVHNLCFLVNNGDGDKAIKKLHHVFIESERN
ncbi:MAG: aspartate kinase, partial [Pseudomonadota bacterium]